MHGEKNFLEQSKEHSRPQSPSFLSHVVGKRRATGRLQIKPSGSGDENEQRTNNKFISHMASTLGLESEPPCLLPAFLQRVQRLFLHRIFQSIQIAQTHFFKKRRILSISFSQRTEGQIINLKRFL